LTFKKGGLKMAHKNKNKSKNVRITKKDIKKTGKKENKNNSKNRDIGIWKITAIALAILIVVSIAFVLIKRNGNNGTCAYDAVKLDFYVMSQCPYGTQVEDAIKPVLDKFGDCIDFNLNFISTDLGDGNFRSLHGEPETKGNIVQLCAAKYNPDKYMDMIVCQNENAGAIPDNWESCAEEYNLDVENIRNCYEGDEGKQLLSENVKLAQAVGATGSPTMYLNDEKYSGGRDELSFTRAICQKMPNHYACASIPECASDADCVQTGKIGKCENAGADNAKCVFTEPVKVDMIVLNDERCESCDTTRTMQVNTQYFPGIESEYVDYNTEEGKQIYEEYNIKYLPAFIFDSNIVNTGTWNTNTRLQSFFDKTGDSYVLKAEAVGSTFDPKSEICDNNIDDTGNGLVDCEDPDCKDKMICREELENNLQVFIMSDCPYGREAVKALKEVVDNFDNIDYEVHYIASESGDGFNSLHGQYEVDENIIQLCVLEHSPDAWLDYIYCRSVNGVKDIDWETCAEETAVDIDAVQACFEGDEGANLLREDIKIAQSLSVSASPTWLANNKYTFSGIDAETVKTNFCEYNEGLDGCDTTLSSGTGASGSC
jgi:hypothetical protein